MCGSQENYAGADKVNICTDGPDLLLIIICIKFIFSLTRGYFLKLKQILG